MQYLIVAYEERCWIMTSVSAMLRYLGMDHPPFPRAGPYVPPLSQPQGVVHDGVGPSGTHPGDTDNDEDTVGDEDEYERNDE